MSGTIQRERPDVHRHSVQFYESDGFLIASAAAFLAEGLRSGRPALMIATPEHQTAIDVALTDHGIDLDTLRAAGRYISCDARATMGEFIADGMPKRKAFMKVAGSLLEQLDTSEGSPCLFGEMVDQLWRDGHVEGALRLEDLWNELRVSHPFSLFCAYKMEHFGTEAASGGFADVVDRHTDIHPGEGWMHPGEDDARALSLLEQKAYAIEQERLRLGDRHVELETMIDRLSELDRIRNDYVAMLMHDIKTPNAIVSGFLHLLRDNWKALSDEQIEDLMARAIDGSDRIMRLANDLLTVARLESGHFTYDKQLFDLAEVAYRSVADVRQACPDRRFELELGEKLPAAFGDPSRQIQIFTNLLTNAAKYSPPGSTVSVSVSRSGMHLLVAVTDEGVGIAPEHHSRLFQRYARFHGEDRSQSDGTGLGLYIAKALVEGQGGTIWVESDTGTGSTFKFTVPVATF